MSRPGEPVHVGLIGARMCEPIVARLVGPPQPPGHNSPGRPTESLEIVREQLVVIFRRIIMAGREAGNSSRCCSYVSLNNDNVLSWTPVG